MSLPGRSFSTLIVSCCAVGLAVLLAFDGALPPPEEQDLSFAPADSDRVALLGARQVEGHIEQGYLETALTAAFPDKELSVRNLAWTGDEVDCRCRSDSSATLLEWVDDTDPDWVFVAYGQMEAFRGPDGRDGFVEAYRALLEALDEPGRQIVMVSPVPHEIRPELPPGSEVDADAHNEALARYTEAIERLADRQGHLFINLFERLRPEATDPAGPALTTNGVYLGQWGYWRAAQEMVTALGVELDGWRVTIDATGDRIETQGTTVSLAAPQGKSIVRFRAREEHLPFPLPPDGTEQGLAEPRVLQVNGLDPTQDAYLLRVDGEPVARATAEEWTAGVELDRDLAFDEAEALRTRVIEKNRQFFYRYRPQNHVQVYGRRKQEGLAEEVRQFEAIVRRHEQRLQRQARPIERTYELAPDPDPPPPLREVERTGFARDEHQPAIAPEQVPPAREVRESFILPDGFEATLFADLETLAGKPIQMRFDPQGRLWVSVTQRYPLIRPGEVANDRIVVLEDTTGDGRADWKRTFAHHLLVPTGMQPGHDGVYVQYDSRLVHLQDTTGDLRADRQRVLLAGIGTDDTHHMAHSFRFSPWGRLYFHQGIFQNTRIETPTGIFRHGESRASSGSFEIDPRSWEVRYHVANSHTANPWGHAFNRWGWAFQMGTNPPSAALMILPTAEGTASTVPLRGDDQTRPMDAEFVGSTHLPDRWKGNLMATFQRGYYPDGRLQEPQYRNRVQRWALKDEGAGFRLEKRTPLVASEHMWFRPTQIRQGPDGALYVADFVTPIIEHAEQHQRDPRRDRLHGRIWRIQHEDRPLVETSDLSAASVDRLLAILRSEEQCQRTQARRVLTERPTREVIPPLRRWAHNLPADQAHPRVQALWLFQAHGVVEEPLLRSLLEADSPEARAAATRVLRYQHEQVDGDPLPLLRERVRDEHPRVRLQAVIALSHLGRPEAMEAALEALDRPTDRFIERALRNTRDALAPHWHAAVREGRMDLARDSARIEFLLESDPPDAVAGWLEQRRTAAKAVADSDPEQAAPPPGGWARQDGERPTLDRGRQLYADTCAECHQAKGQGVEGVFPPLVESEFVLDPQAESLIRIVLDGLTGPVEVRGERYDGFMPPFGHLSDDELAALLSYVRSAWGNDADPVPPALVQKVRRATDSRTQPWTADELESQNP
jgi:putative membrane-bound dehydrogenase-like protein